MRYGRPLAAWAIKLGVAVLVVACAARATGWTRPAPLGPPTTEDPSRAAGSECDSPTGSSKARVRDGLAIRPSPDRAVPREDRSVVKASLDQADRDIRGGTPAEDRGSPPKAVISSTGAVRAGSRVELDGGESTGEALRYLWFQTRGPKVSADNWKAARLNFIAPESAPEFAFRLVVTGPGGVDSAEVAMPGETRGREGSPTRVRADAGDDQVGLVGHRITLHGRQIESRDRVSYRWIKADGPRIDAATQENGYFSFTPTAPGRYRILLVVAADGSISDPDEMVLEVGTIPRAAASVPPSPAPTSAGSPWLRELDSLPGGGRGAARALADSFEMIASRLDLYANYNDVQNGLSTRLRSALPEDAAARTEWDQRLFAPLTLEVIETMRREGIDLGVQDNRARMLTGVQKSRLRSLFRGISARFREVSPSKDNSIQDEPEPASSPAQGAASSDKPQSIETENPPPRDQESGQAY